MFLTHDNRHYLLKTVILITCVGLGFSTFAKEGMWLPPTLKSREADMKSMGLQIPVDKIYNPDGSGLNNSIVLFGSGCTGEIISPKGLLLTNHHCGYGTVQGLSSRERDYFANGFFAMNMSEEIPCPGLSVTYIRKMENVSGIILADIPDTMASPRRDSLISGRIRNLEKGYRYTTGMDAAIKPYFNGNQYWVIITETFRDIRLVGFPPNGIGQFGGDTDNWMWPRHTGDFSMFRVYAGKNNKPAAYSKENKPYTTKNFLTINASGYKEGDFTMVYGFPGTTQEYISSYQLNQIYSITDPIRIDVRTQKLASWTKNMSANRDVFLKYTSKRASVANGWKKWQGEVRGLRINDVTGKKQAFENEFQSWAASDTSLHYADDLLARLQVNALHADSALKAETYIQEAFFGIEILQQAAFLDRLLPVMRAKLSQATLRDSLGKLVKGLAGFYKNYDHATDKAAFTSLMTTYYNNGGSWIPAGLRKTYAEYGRNWSRMADDVFALSLLADSSRLAAFAANVSARDTVKLLSDPAWRLYNTVNTYRRNTLA
ncbi:MAG: serine protease, partial [Sphingobacteriales bacterium]